MESTTADWVSETRFGKWFLSTETWYREVLSVALREMREIAGPSMPPIRRLLDVGCGQGRSFELLAERFRPREIVAVDIDPLMVRIARDTAGRCAVPVTVMQGSVKKLDLADGSVDAIVCHQLIHHCSQQAQVLSELFRVLAPGGMLLLGESCEEFIDTWSVRWFFRHPPGVQHSADEYVRMVRDAGFGVAPRDIRTSTPWWSLWEFGILRRYGLVRSPLPVTELLLLARKS